MKIALAQINTVIGDFDHNLSKIRANIKTAREAGAQVIVFPEMCIPGYPAADFLEFDYFVDECYRHIQALAAESHQVAVVVGGPVKNQNPRGKPLFNAAFVLYDGKIHSIVKKSLLPDYDVFDEYRYFEPNTEFRAVDLPFGRLAVTICEDLWGLEDSKLYTSMPMDELVKQHPDVIINIAASPFHYRQTARRTDVLSRNAKLYGLPLVNVNQVGGQTELLFDGESIVLDQHGRLSGKLKKFEEDFALFDIRNLPVEARADNDPEDVALIYDALVMGIRDYFTKMGFKKAILGLSGGIDSAVVLALAAEALGKDYVISLLMPSPFSSQHSLEDAREMLVRTKSPYEIVKINQPYEAFLELLEPYFANRPFDVTEENIQARIRANLLMAFSNKFGYILLNTSNKSEAAVGYGTLYGDMCGGLSVLGDVYKSQVNRLAHYINRKKEIIPENIITKAPSAELRHNQKDTDSLPEYDILDGILTGYIENKLGPDQISGQGYDRNLVDMVINMVNASEWKRYQMAPVLRVSPKAFGSGRRMPIVGKYLFR